MLLAVASNGLGLLEIRFLALQGKPGKIISGNLTAAAHPEIADILSRPDRPLHPDRFVTIFNFVLLQIKSICGKPSEDAHFLYTMSVGPKRNVGRTSGVRSKPTYVSHGIIPRWTEHVRELYSTMNRTVLAYRKRNRYVCLSKPLVGPGLSFIINSSHSGATIARAEAFAIALASFPANGSQFKHIAEKVRHANRKNAQPRTNGRARRRATVRAKKDIRKKLLTDNLDIWAQTFREDHIAMPYPRKTKTSLPQSMTIG